MKQQRKIPSKTETGNGQTQISIAKIGLVSAIAVAVVSLIGTALSAYFSSQAVQAPILISIQATQTAEANIASKTTVLSSTLSTPIISSTSIISQPIPTNTPVLSTPTSTATPTSLVEDWTTIFQLYPWKSSCYEPAVIPNTIDLTGDLDNSFKQILQAINNNDVDMWESAPDQGSLISIARNIVSKSENKEWIQLSNIVRVTVRARNDIPDHVDVLSECAGLGEFRIFPPISLESRFDQYEQTTTYQGADFFSLQPGEFESFHLKFQCITPGIYALKINIPYTYLGHSGTITFNPPDFVCPQSYTVWTTLGGLDSGNTYVWNGAEYIKTP